MIEAVPSSDMIRRVLMRPSLCFGGSPFALWQSMSVDDLGAMGGVVGGLFSALGVDMPTAVRVHDGPGCVHGCVHGLGAVAECMSSAV